MVSNGEKKDAQRLLIVLWITTIPLLFVLVSGDFFKASVFYIAFVLLITLIYLKKSGKL